MEILGMLAISKQTRTILIFVAVIVLLVQYVLTLIAFKKVVQFDTPVKKLVIWNFVIIFAIIVGPIIAIIHGIRQEKAAREKELDQDALTVTATESNTISNNVDADTVDSEDKTLDSFTDNDEREINDQHKTE